MGLDTAPGLSLVLKSERMNLDEKRDSSYISSSELRSTQRAVRPRDAATLIIVRGDGINPRVLMGKRAASHKFMPNKFVFPGGKVDLHDAHEEYEKLYAGHDDKEASDILSVPQYGLAYWTGAIRECFEEAGILMAYDTDGNLLDLHNEATKTRFAAHRDALNNGDKTMLDICNEENLTLATDLINYFSHWVTPTIIPRRFDTRFFVCKAPAAQESLIDNHEAVSQCWITPSQALKRSKEGTFQIFFPTIAHLKAIGKYATTDELMAASAEFTDIPRTLPTRKELPDGKVKIVLPGEEGYDAVEPLETHY